MQRATATRGRSRRPARKPIRNRHAEDDHDEPLMASSSEGHVTLLAARSRSRSGGRRSWGRLLPAVQQPRAAVARATKADQERRREVHPEHRDANGRRSADPSDSRSAALQLAGPAGTCSHRRRGWPMTRRPPCAPSVLGPSCRPCSLSLRGGNVAGPKGTVGARWGLTPTRASFPCGRCACGRSGSTCFFSSL